jgi:hypothetical protein
MRLILVMACLGVIASEALAGKWVAGKTAKVYKGAHGVQVTLVPVSDGQIKRSLVLVNGADSKIEDVALLHVAEPGSRETAYYTFINDDKFYTLVFSENSGALALPEAPTKKISLKYNDKDSKKVDTAAALKAHEQQLKDGTIAKLEISQESDWRGHVNSVVRRSADDAKSACGNAVGARVDWDSVDKTLFNKIALATMCRQVTDSLARRCHADAGKKASTAVDSISCVVSKSQNLTLGRDKRLIWNVPESGAVDLTAMESKINSLIK